MDHETPAPPPGPAPAPPPAQGTCQNCGAPLYGKYCHACGQPAASMVRHFSSILGDAADSLFNVDARLFRTIVPLYLRPGRLTLDYLAGRRARYVAPFRLVFFLAIAAFFALQLTLRVEPAHPAATDTGAATTTAPDRDAAFSNGDIRVNGRVLWNGATKPIRGAWLPAPLADWLNERVANAQFQLRRLTSGPAAERAAARYQLARGMFAAAPTVLFVLLPVFALLLKIFYAFRHRLYMEHLIVAMYSHAFLMLSMLVLVAITLVRSWLQPHAARLAAPLALARTVAWIWIFVYLWLAQKRIYRQGWLVTTVKYCGLGFWYSILVGFGWAFAGLMSLTGT